MAPPTPIERFELIFRAHHARVLAYARRRLPEQADDVVAETFLVAWRRFDELPEQPLPWLLGVARRVIATRLRGASRRQALIQRLAQDVTVGASAPDGALAPDPRVPNTLAPDTDSPIWHALAALPANDREALLLIAWDGLEPREAAAVLHQSPASFRVRLHRARRRLRALLQEPEEPAPGLALNAQEVSP